MKKSLIVLIVVLFSFIQKGIAQGCSQCKLLAEQASEMDETSFGTNINSGILYLMIIPYLLILFLFRKRIISFIRFLFLKFTADKTGK
jgi:hypothetical protein